MNSAIVDRGRGPEIAGTRITVYDVMDYYRQNWHHTAIATWLRLSSDQVLAAIQYIEAHKDEIQVEYNKMLERETKGNSPDVQAKLDAIHAKYEPLWAERRRSFSKNADG